MWQRIRLGCMLLLLGALSLGTQPRIEIRFDPIVGSVVDSMENGLEGIQVRRFGLYHSGFSDQDSAVTDEHGQFYLEEGFPNLYTLAIDEESRFACRPSTKSYTHYRGMEQFLLIFVNSIQDTTIAGFFTDSTSFKYHDDGAHIEIDIAFIGPGETYGPPGGVREIPPIVFKLSMDDNSNPGIDKGLVLCE